MVVSAAVQDAIKDMGQPESGFLHGLGAGTNPWLHAGEDNALEKTANALEHERDGPVRLKSHYKGWQYGGSARAREEFPPISIPLRNFKRGLEH